MDLKDFSKSEINHLLTLISMNEEDGTHYGNYDQFIKRSDRIKAKLNKILSNEREGLGKHEQKEKKCTCELWHTTNEIKQNLCISCNNHIK